MSRSDDQLKPRNGHTLVTGIVARISGCAKQKEASLEDQVDHGKEEVVELIEGRSILLIETKARARTGPPRVGRDRGDARTRELDLLVQEDVGRLIAARKPSGCGGSPSIAASVAWPNDDIDTVTRRGSRICSACASTLDTMPTLRSVSRRSR